MLTSRFSEKIFVLCVIHVTHLFSFNHQDQIIMHQPFTKKQTFLGLPAEFSPSAVQNTIKSQLPLLPYSKDSARNKNEPTQNSTHSATFHCKDGTVTTTSDIAKKFEIVEHGGTDLTLLDIKKKSLVKLINIAKNKESVASLSKKELRDSFNAAVKLEMSGYTMQRLADRCSSLGGLGINKNIIHREQHNMVARKSDDYIRLKNIFQKIANGQVVIEGREIVKWSGGGQKLDLSYQGLSSLDGIELLASPGILDSMFKPKRTQHFFPNSVKRIDLSGNNLRSLRLQVLKKVFPNLNKVFAQHNKIEKLDSSDLALMSGIKIDFSDNLISSLPTSLWRVPQDCELNLSKNRLSQESCDGFNKLMATPSSFQVFDTAATSMLSTEKIISIELLGLAAFTLYKLGFAEFLEYVGKEFIPQQFGTHLNEKQLDALSLLTKFYLSVLANKAVTRPLIPLGAYLANEIKPGTFDPAQLSLDSQFHRESLNNELAAKYSNVMGLKLLSTIKHLPSVHEEKK